MAILASLVILKILYRPILALKEMVEDLAMGNGDLTRRLTVNSDDDLGQISAGINRFIAKLQEMLLEIKSAAAHSSHSAQSLKAMLTGKMGIDGVQAAFARLMTNQHHIKVIIKPWRSGALHMLE